MRLVEIRDLDGPNLFLLSPAIKIELEIGTEADLTAVAQRMLSAISADSSGPTRDELSELASAVDKIVGHTGAVVRTLEEANRIAIAFDWNHRRAALCTARLIADLCTGIDVDVAETLRAIEQLSLRYEPDDRPLMVTDAQRRIPIVGITGTNGKTTTTRLLAHILANAGRLVGWSSSSGVYVDGEEVLTGDYSGPSGARRVLFDPTVEVAVLETARGGILLRGIAYESNDVSIFTNVSADHLGLQGVTTIEGLAQVKSVVIRVTKADGIAVLNGDDPLVLDACRDIRAEKLLFSRNPSSPNIQEHIAQGGRVIVSDGPAMYLRHMATDTFVAGLEEIPIAYGGRAHHMVENALAAAGAAVGLGLDLETVRAGLTTFRNSAAQNLGRLNVFDIDGATVILDYAHNEAGLEHLIAFARTFLQSTGRLALVIGTAGDRTDQSIEAIGRISAESADRVIIKASPRYLRGRDIDELIELYQRGIRAGGKSGAPLTPTEVAGVELGLADLKPGDVLAVMSQEQMVELTELLTARGAASR